MANVVDAGGIEGFPSLQSICDLFRSLVNDSYAGGTGEIATDQAAFMKPFLNSAIRDLYSDLRISGSMNVIVDNFILTGLPAVNAANPSVQTALTYNGYFNGTTWAPNFRLPADLMWVVKLWQRPTGSAAYFCPMREAPAGLAGGYQGNDLGAYEVRGGNEVWFNGATLPTDLRIRYKRGFPDIVGDSIDFSNTFVAIQDSTNAIAYKMTAKYAFRLSPEQFAMANGEALVYTNKLKSETVLNNQNKEYQRLPFGGALQDGGV